MDENNQFDSLHTLQYEKSQNNCFLIDTEEEANKILGEIINKKGCIIGIDIEAAVEMSRFGILCLLQVKFISKLRYVIITEYSFSI